MLFVKRFYLGKQMMGRTLGYIQEIGVDEFI